VRLAVVIGLAAAAVLFGFLVADHLPKEIGIDYLAWESSTQLFLARHNPYDVDELGPRQQANGWDTRRSASQRCGSYTHEDVLTDSIACERILARTNKTARIVGTCPPHI
jgi:hypothetical protein